MRGPLTPRLTLLAVAHCSIDAYSSFFSPLLPLLVHKLNLSLTLVGTLVALASLSSSFSQPLFGLLSDRVRRPWFVAFGPLTAALLMSSIGLAPSFGALAALLVLAGVGVGAFHPQAAALASSLGERRSMSMAIFVTGGTLGFSLGPIFAVSVVGAVGLDHTYFAAIPGVLMSAVLLFWFLRVPARPRHLSAPPALRELKPVLWPLTLLYMAVVVRSAVSYGFMTFLPLHLTSRHWSVQAAGYATSLYLLLGALGGFLGGWLADRWGGRKVVVASFICAAPLYFAFLFLPDRFGLAALVLGSFLLQTSLPVNVVLGQELSPRHSSVISSLLMGAAWGVGALLIGPVGALADAQGLHAALMVLASLMVVGVACAAALPPPHRHALPAEMAQAPTGVAGR